MSTIPELIEAAQKINVHLQIIKQAEDESIREVLKFFGIPENKEEGGNLSIEQLLQKDQIHIILAQSSYNKINFSQLRLPKKLTITSSIHIQNVIIYGEIKEDYIFTDLPYQKDKYQMLLQGFTFKPE